MNPKLILGGCALALSVAAAAFLFASNDSAADDTRQVVYLCHETGATIVAAPQPTPAVNPATGRATLVQALYCEKCQKWRPMPSLELLQRNRGAGRCPRHRTPLTLDGPLPN